MIVYIIGFSVSTLLFYFSNKVVKKQQWIIISIALMIPCLIAGFRADSVGTDVKRYLVQMTDAAISSNGIKDYLNKSWYMIWQNLYVSDYEYGFSFLVYIVAKLFKNIYAVQFFIQAFTVVPIYFALRIFHGNISRFCWLGMLTYYLIFFNVTLNAMRQTIAMAFILLAFAYLFNNKQKECTMFTIIAIFFHTSALIGIIIFLIYKYVEMDRKNNLRVGWIKISGNYMNMLITIFIAIISLFGLSVISALLTSLGLSKYIAYIGGTISFMPNQVIIRIPIIALFMYCWKKNINDSKIMRFLFTMLCLDLICSQFTSINSYSGRIALYFAEFQILMYPIIYTKTNKNKVLLLLLTIYMSIYWWYYFVYSGSNATVPYIIGI